MRLDPGLYQRLHRRAEVVGVSVPEFIRWTLRKACPEPLEEPLTVLEDWR